MALLCAMLVAGSSAAVAPGLVSPSEVLIMEKLYRVEIPAAGPGEKGLKGQGQTASPEVLDCLTRSTLPEGTQPVTLRVLCEENKEPRFALFHRLDPKSKFAIEATLVDVADADWIRFRAGFPKSDSIREHESTLGWMTRLSSGENGRPRVRIDTDMLRFDPIGEDEDLVPYAEKLRKDIADRQPELAGFLEWLTGWIGAPHAARLSGMSELAFVLSQFGGFESAERTGSVKVTEVDSQVVRGKVKTCLDPDMEERFGKWASWPDPPRLND